MTANINDLPQGLRRLLTVLRVMVFSVLLPLLSGLLGWVIIDYTRHGKYGPVVAGLILASIAIVLAIICVRWAGLLRKPLTPLEQAKYIDDTKVYRCRVAVRERSPKGGQTKPGFERLNGREFILRPMWRGDDDERYPGEWAMMLSRDDQIALDNEGIDLAWIANGDVVVLDELERAGNWQP